MSMLNIDELRNEKKEKIKQKNEVYESVLKKCHAKIKSVAKILSAPECCIFEVPPYIYGCPLYDINKCIYYLVECLSENGFEVQYLTKNMVYVSWEGKKNPRNFKTLEKKQEKKFKSIEDFTPSNNYIYDTKMIDNLKKQITF